MSNLLFRLAMLFAASTILALPCAAEAPITAIAFSPDGNSVLTASQLGVGEFSWPDLHHQRTIEVSSANLHQLAFSPEGDKLAVAGGHPAQSGEVTVLSWPEATAENTLRYHDDSVTDVAWYNSKELVSSSMDHEVVRWSTTNKTPQSVLRGHSRGVTSVALLAQQNVLISAGIDQSLRVWDLQSGELTRSLSIHTLPINDIAVSPSSTGLPLLATASDDKTIRFWQPTIGRMVRFAKLDSKPLSIAWLPEGTEVLAACVDGKVRRIDSAKVTVTQTSDAIDGWAYALAVHPTEPIAVAGGQNGQLVKVHWQDPPIN